MITIGSDECGYGAWAGPLYVCAYAAPEAWSVPGLDDSKRLRPAARRQVYSLIDLSRAALVRVAVVDIDQLGIAFCLRRAHSTVLRTLLHRFPDARVVVDGLVKVDVSQAECIPHADALVPAVMAASIVAKCNRDLEMQRLHATYPKYGFASHVGYGTPEHQAALRAYGPCELHRRSYRPIKELLDGAAHRSCPP